MSREIARSLGLKRFFTGLPCRNGHVDERLVSNNICLGCARKNNQAHYKRALKEQRNTAEGRAKRIENGRRYWDNNRDAIAARRRDQYAAQAEKKRAQRKEWAEANKDSVLASQRKIKFQRMQRAPMWLSDDDWAAMEAIYIQSRAMSKQTGTKHHVDHIVPLVGKKVSGLHVPWNLQILPANDNLKKSNKLIEA